MNINGHEVERRDGPGPARVYIDGEDTDYTGSRDPDFYTRAAVDTRTEIARLTKEADHADLIAEFVRREAAEKAEQEAANELDRRAALVRTTMRRHGWEFGPDFEMNVARQIVRALDADTATRDA